ncbi:hypothetical protein GCM10023093_16980 [Nemorincola caseinilytica]|uniref:PRTRC system protein E n=1 Tax=Nemorincola caseinilytica TaxID=2054315 RepID=A0ABP8NFW2_9BACT
MKISETLLARARKIFERNEARDKLYITADGQIFVRESDANGQATNLGRAGGIKDVAVLLRTTVGSPAEKTLPKAGDKADVPATHRELTAQEIAADLAKEAAAKLNKMLKALVETEAKHKKLKEEQAALPITATANRKTGIANRITAAAEKISTLTTDIEAAKAKQAETDTKTEDTQEDETNG